MRGAKFLNCTAKRRQKNRTVQTVRSVVSFSWGASAGLPPLRGPRCTALVARLLLCRIRRAGEHAVSASPLRCAASAEPGSMPVPLPLSASPLRCAARLRCSRCRPVARPRSGWRSRRFRAPSLLHWVAPFVLPPPCRAAGFIAWRPAPDRSAGPRCRAPCGRCLPRSPTR